jgi:hypothetical protein
MNKKGLGRKWPWLNKDTAAFEAPTAVIMKSYIFWEYNAV